MKKPFKEYVCGICLAEYDYKPKKCDKCGTVFEKESSPEIEDKINKPNHYHKNNIDVIGFSELQFPKEELKGFYRINCLKYITRFDRKGGLEDLKKASFYLNKLLELEGEEINVDTISEQ